MKPENKELIMQVVELFEKFETEAYKSYDTDCSLIFSTLGKDKYQLQLYIELRSDNFEESKSINLKVKNGELFIIILSQEKTTIKQLEYLLFEILEPVYN